MFARVKKSGGHEYLQIVENQRVGKKISQRVIATVGRLDRMSAKGEVETLVRSLSRFSEKVLLILSDRSQVGCEAKTIGPALIFERLWQELGMAKVIKRLLSERLFGFDVERAIFLTVVHRLLVSGSDRFCERWKRDHLIGGTDELSIHHLYRAMGWLGEVVEDQGAATGLSPRCTKDLVEEALFLQNHHLFRKLNLVFLDTTSLYFEGNGGEELGRRGFSKDFRPHCNQMVIAVVLDETGRPLCCEMWPGNTTDVKTLLPVMERIRKRFQVVNFCVVSDRGMVSRDTVEALEKAKIPYILGTRMRQVKEIREEVLSRPGRYKEVVPEGASPKDPSPLKVKEVWVGDKRYIVCLNSKQARKDAGDREFIVESLREQIKRGVKKLVGNKGYRKFLKIERGSVSINLEKIEAEKRFDGKWVLTTNTQWSPEAVALRYKELWQVEHAFRDLKSTFETRPVFHQRDRTIRGHVFCSFLALVLRKELMSRLQAAGHTFEWAEIKQDLHALKEVRIEENGKKLAVRSQCLGTCGKIFQALRVALPPTVREIIH